MKLSLFVFLLLNFHCALASGDVRPDTPLFSIGVVTDVHYSNRKEPVNNRYYRASEWKLQEAVATFNDAHVDLVVSLGDLIDSDSDSFADIAPVLESSKAPVYRIAGNHDFLVPFDARKQQAALRMMGVGKLYFSVIRDGYRLLFLDGNDIALYAHATGTPQYAQAERIFTELTFEGAANARDYNGAIGSEQQAWLIRELEKATAAGQEVLCFCHMPVLPLLGRYTLWNNLQIARLLGAWPCVKAYLAGHHHPGGYGAYQNVHYVTFRGMIDGPRNQYAVVDVYADKLVIRGFGTQKSMTLPNLR